MDIEILKNALNKYGYSFIEQEDTIIVKLEFAQQITINFKNSDKVIISDKLTGWNFLTGYIKMSFKNAMIYNFIGVIVIALVNIYADLNNISLHNLFLLLGIWILMWTFYYAVKLESFKCKIMHWIDK